MTYGAIDIGGTKTIVALADENASFIGNISFETEKVPAEIHFNKCIEKLKNIVEDNKSSFPKKIGISLPGIVNRERKILTNAFYAGWQGINVVDWFEKTIGVETIIDNDVNACAYGEIVFGNGGKYRDFVWVTVSTGIGGAVVIDNTVISGSNGCAGEFGHIKVEENNPLQCSCGQFGCLEAQASGSAITRYTLDECEKNYDFRREFEKRNLQINATSCSILAKENNITAKRIFNKAAKYIGLGLSSVVNVLNPEAIIFGGGVCRSFELLEDEIRDTVLNNVTASARNIVIEKTPLGYEAALYGALALAMKG